MPVFQTTFNAVPNQFREGHVLGGFDTKINSYIAKTDIPFGRAVYLSKGDTLGKSEVTLGVDANGSNKSEKFVGISVIDVDLEPGNNNMYKQGDKVNILEKGLIVVSFGGAVSDINKTPLIVKSTGKFLDNAAATAANIDVDNVAIKSKLSAAGLGIVEVFQPTITS